MKFHHLGYVVKSIPQWEEQMLCESKVNEVFDPVQNAQLAIYKNFNNHYIELIQPLNKNSFTWNFLSKNGQGFHHICYEIQNMNELRKIADNYKLIPILNPVPALLFEGKYVTFYYARNKQIIEFILNDYSS